MRLSRERWSNGWLDMLDGVIAVQECRGQPALFRLS